MAVELNNPDDEKEVGSFLCSILNTAEALLKACEVGNCRLVKSFSLKNIQQDDLDLYLSVVCANSSPELIEFFLQAGANPNTDHYPLLKACKEQSIAVVDLLLYHGADPNYPNNQPLQVTLESYTNIEIVKLLLQYGADFETLTKDMGLLLAKISRYPAGDKVRELIDLLGQAHLDKYGEEWCLTCDTELVRKYVLKKNEPKQYWYFTFGWGQNQERRYCYCKIYGTHGEALAEMTRRFGQEWSMQYPSAKAAGVDKFNLTEIN